MSFSQDTLKAAHNHCRCHQQEVTNSELCGCFYCCETFLPTDINFWLDDEGSALCPICTIDSVIGSASGYPVNDRTFLKAMHKFWFGNDVGQAENST